MNAPSARPTIRARLPAWIGLTLLLAAGLWLRCSKWSTVFPPPPEGTPAKECFVNFVDPDCYSRMARVRELRAHPLQPVRWHSFENHPYGIRSHATSPLDYLILAGGALLRPFTPAAWDLAGAWISPLLGLLGALFLWSWSARYFPPLTRWAMLLLYALLPAIAWSQNVGRPDHQGLLLLLLLVALCREVDLWREPASRFVQVTGGIAWAVALWTSLYEPGLIFAVVLVVQLVTRRLALFTARPLWWAALAATLLLAFLIDGNPVVLPDPALKTHLARWLAVILEQQPTGARRFTLYLGLWAWLLPVAVVFGLFQKNRDRRNVILFAILALALCAVGYLKLRWMPYASLLIVLFAVPLVFHLPGRHWQPAAAFFLSVPIFVGSALALERRDAPDDSSAMRLIARRIARDPGGILAPGGIAPPLMYFSGCPIVASMSHENLQASIDTAYFWADTNWIRIRETLEKRNVRWVVVYRAENLAQESAWMLHGRFMNDPAVRRLAHFPDFVGTRLARGDRVPHWLRLRAAADDLRLYEFTP